MNEYQPNADGLTITEARPSGKKGYINCLLSCGHRREIKSGHAKTGKFACKECADAKRNSLVQASGLELVSPGENARSSSVYRFVDCGHTIERRPSTITGQSIACPTCLVSRLEQEASKQGFTLLDDDAPKNYGWYQCKECGATQKIAYSNMRVGNCSCSSCRQKHHSSGVSTHGLELLGPSERVSFYRYRLSECGHEIELRSDHAASGSFKCSVCFTEKLAREFSAHGLTLGSRAADKKWSYSCNNCGYEGVARPTRVRAPTFRCPSCHGVKSEDNS